MAEGERETCQHMVEVKQAPAKPPRSLNMESATQSIYHGRTELGIGQHEEIKKILNEELYTDYGDHLKKEETDRVQKVKDDGEPQTVYGYESPTGSVADIGYESAMSIVNKHKQLSEDRKADYEAHLAAKSGATFQQDGSGDATRTSTEDAQDGSENVDENDQNQHGYAEYMRDQIAEKKTITDRIKKKEDIEDERNEWAHGSRKHFNVDPPSMKRLSGSSQSSDHTRKQQDYAKALKNQIAENKKDTDGLKKKREDEKSDLAHVGSQHFSSESQSMKRLSGSSQSSDHTRKQQDYAEALKNQIAENKKDTDGLRKKREDERSDLAHVGSQHSSSESQFLAECWREQIAEKKTITDRNKKKEDIEDERNEWANGSRKHFNVDPPTITDRNKKKEDIEDERNEWANGSRKHFNVDPPTITDRNKKKEDIEYERNEWANGSRKHFNVDPPTITDRNKKKEDIEDERNEWANGSRKHFNVDPSTITDRNKKKEVIEDERNEWANGSRKHFNVDPPTITDRNKKKEDIEDEGNEWANGSRKHFNVDSLSMKGFSGSSQASEKDEHDEHRQKQLDYAEELTHQIAEKKIITDGIKNMQAFVDESNERTEEARKPAPHHFIFESPENVDENDQNQHGYAEYMRDQIAEKKTITDRIKKKEDIEDERNEWAHGSRKHFNVDPPKKSGYPASHEMYGQEELGERRQKQHDYADALRDQIAEKKVITDGIKKKEDDEDEKNEWAHGSSHGYQAGSYGQLSSSGGGGGSGG